MFRASLGRGALGAIVAIAVLLVPAAAQAATAPTLVNPVAGAGPAVGGSIKFEWSGDLQGDATQLSRSYFRLEVAKVEDVPSGAQAVWPKLERFQQTDPGATSGTLTTGVPTADSYKWRVCAWGVADVAAVNEIVQLPGGCSGARAFASVAAASKTSTIGVIDEQHKVTVTKPTEVVTRERNVPTAKIEPVVIEVPVTREKAQSTVTKVVRREPAKGGKRASAVSLDDGRADGLGAEAAGDRRAGLGGAVLTGLSSNLPGIPIPFWTLALLGAAIPLVRRWRRNVLGMFDWPDEQDGRGDLHDVSRTTLVKSSGSRTDIPTDRYSEDSRAA